MTYHVYFGNHTYNLLDVAGKGVVTINVFRL